MGPAELLRWQWEGYPRYHARRANLLLHICSVPFFWAGTVLLLVGALSLNWVWTAVGFACLLVPVIVQGIGHKRLESTPPAPFTSPWNFIARFCLEQWINFPRFLLSGAWWNNLRAG